MLCNRRTSRGQHLLLCTRQNEALFWMGLLSFTIKTRKDLQKYRHIHMKSLKGSQATATPQLSVALSPYETVVDVGKNKQTTTTTEKPWKCILSCTCIMSKGSQDPNGVPVFSLTPLIGSPGSSSPRYISGCVPKPQEKEIKCHFPPSPY